MKYDNAIIIHGMPSEKGYYGGERKSPSNAHWLPWLQRELLIRKIKADTPEIPEPYQPKYDIWKREFERFDITPESLLVGHSCGGGFIVRYLSENVDVRVAKVVLVAPWIDPEKELSTNFFDFTIDENLMQRVGEIVIFLSDNDERVTQESAQIINKKIPGSRLVEFHKYGHFCENDLGGVEFPELLKEILN